MILMDTTLWLVHLIRYDKQCATNWQGEIQALRSILFDCGLDEELKWGNPCTW